MAAGDTEETLPFPMNHLPDYFKEQARRELNESPERRIAGLKELKEMATDHKMTCDVRFVDDFLLQFLRQRKYDVARAFKQLVNLACYMKNHSSFFRSIDNDLFFSHPQFCNILPRRCPEGCAIIIFELGKWDPEEFPVHQFYQMGIMLFTQTLRDPMNQINGYKVIFDFKDTSWKQARYFTPTNLYLLYQAGMDCLPARYKAIHLVSDSLIMRTTWTLVKPIISQKLKQRISLNASGKDLLNHFPASVLPAQYGGLLEDYYTTDWTKDINRQQEGFTLQGQCNYY